VLNSTERAAEQVALIHNWSRDLLLFTDGPAGLDEKGRRRLHALGVPVKEGRISRLEGGPGGAGRGLSRVVFEDGTSLDREEIFYTPPQRQRSEIAGMLGCEIGAMGPLGAVVKSDPMTRETTVPGVYVAGDAAGAQAVLLAAASGAAAAGFANHALAAEDAETEAQDAISPGSTRER